MVKVSVVIPVCNVAPYLERCLDSMLGQTLKEIEYICVDDCSTDGCVEILKKYEKKDSRMKVIYHNTNQSTSQSRKDGVLASTGKYVMFLDSDDVLRPEACQCAYEAISSKGVDVVHFGTKVVNCGGVPEARITMNEKLLEPYSGTIKNRSLVKACWEEGLFGYTLWNKIYDGELCRKAFGQVEDGSFPKAQDLYAEFLLLYYARSYAGIEKILYEYSLGIGVTGGNVLSLEKYRIFLTEYRVWTAIDRFMQNKPEKEEYQKIVDGIYLKFIKECVNKWLNDVAVDFRSEAFDSLIEMWGLEAVMECLTKFYYYRRSFIAEKMQNLEFFRYKKRTEKKQKTIALYYHSIRNGGAQRVVAQLCNILAELKNSQGELRYRVVLVTDELEDEEIAEAEYPLNSIIQREYLPHFKLAVKGGYKERYKKWEQIISEHDVDAVISSAWVAPSSIWDMLAIKGQPSKPAYIVHCHSFSCVPFTFVNDTGAELSYRFQICDGVITLSECDVRFVETFSKHVKCIPNPLAFSLESVEKSKCEENAIMWCGRISHEKHVMDTIWMMKHLVKKIPDAKLYIVGSGKEEMEEHMKTQIHQLGLSDHIEMAGFQEDVGPFYKKASVVLSTSEYEGFSLVIAEAFAHGVPVVCYDMPWLPFVQDGRGIITVNQQRYDLMAEKVAQLLENHDLCRKYGEQGREQIREMMTVDIGEEWSSFLEEIDGPDKEKTVPDLSCDENILFNYLTVFQQKGRAKLEKERSALKKKLREKEEEVKELKNINRSMEYRLGKTLLKPARKLQKILKHK